MILNDTVATECPVCEGTGKVQQTDVEWDTCRKCNGKGWITVPSSPPPVGQTVQGTREGAGYKKRYTIGALFSPDMHFVLLIKKARPEWQEGKFNLPGGHIEEGETPAECVRREFIEETGVEMNNWKYVGQIDSPGEYFVDYFAAVVWPDYPEIKNESDEETHWHSVYDLPDNCISNLHWLVPFAKNVLEQGNHDFLTFGKFTYEYR